MPKQITIATRDRKVYDLARRYILGLSSAGVTEELLDHYLNPPSNPASTMADVFERLLKSAQNRGMMPSVIGDSIGGVEALGPLFGGFSPAAAIERFATPDDLLNVIKREVQPTGQFRRGRGSLWPLFARAALSGATFLSQFESGQEFVGWVKDFDVDDRKRAALPMLLSQEIDGFGFALACDFLKELGFRTFAKPDVHVKAIVKGLGLSSETANDYAVFKAVVRIAARHRTTWTSCCGWLAAVYSTIIPTWGERDACARIGRRSSEARGVRSVLRHNRAMQRTVTSGASLACSCR